MSKTITSTITSYYTLSGSGNPLSIASSGGVVVPGGTAIYGGTGSLWTITNAGIVSAGTRSNSLGINLKSGSVINAGQIYGYHYGVRMRGLGDVVTNTGTIHGHTDGVALFEGGSVSNAASGLIAGTANDGVYISGDNGTVTNAGTIRGATPADAVQLVGTYTDRVIVDPGAVFVGTVAGGGGNSSLELARGNGTTGTIDGFGTSFTGFGSIAIDTTASWTFDSTSTIASGVTLNTAGTLTNRGDIGTTVVLASTGTLDNKGLVSGPNDGVVVGGGLVVNEIGKTIASGNVGISGITSAATIDNAGDVSADAYGVYLSKGGAVTNLGTIASLQGGILGYGAVMITGGSGSVFNGGMITGGRYGVHLTGAPDTLTNAGTISSDYDAVQFGGSSDDRVILDPGAVFYGRVVGGEGGGNVLEMAQGVGGTGTLTNFSTQFTRFGTIVVDASALWTFDGTDTIATGGRLTDSGSLLNKGSIDTTITVTSGARLDNFGTVTSAAPVLLEGGTLVNDAGGAIAGTSNQDSLSHGVDASGRAPLVTNAGSISGMIMGVEVSSGGSVDNEFGGTVLGTYVAGVEFYDTGMVTNAGTIDGASGVKILLGGGSISNASGGLIRGGNEGVYLYGAGTITNAGTIVGNAYAIQFAGTYTDRLIVDPGAVFTGTVAGGAGTNTLELAQGTSAAMGALSNFGSQFNGFGTIAVDPGAAWTFDMSDRFGAVPLNDAGTVLFTEASGATLTEAVTISGTGDVVQSGAGTLVLDGSDKFTGGVTIGGGTLELAAGNAAAAGPIVFAGDPALRIDGAIMPAGTIYGLAVGDQIDLAGDRFTKDGSARIFHGNTLQVIENQIFDLTLDPHQTLSGLAFQLTEDAGTGTLITVDAACYCRGTRIRTTRGDVAVEDLVAGDRVVTLSGAARPIRWIGHRRLDLRRHPAPDRVRPIRIRAGAFADGVPTRDLLISPDHAVLLDGVLIPAGLLLNGASVTRTDERGMITYYHVELETHDILLAENLPAESYLDTGNRGMFANAGAAVSLHPDLTNDQARRQAESCAPFADDPARVEPVWRTLAARAAGLGWALPPQPETTDDPGLYLLVDGQRVAPATAIDGHYVFLLPGHVFAPAGSGRPPGARPMARLVSRNAVARETRPWIADERRLGVLLRGLTLRFGVSVLPIPLDHPELAEGWWQPEWHGPHTLRRWTNGDALLPLPATLTHSGLCLLDIEVAHTMPFPLPSRRGAAVDRVVSGAASSVA